MRAALRSAALHQPGLRRRRGATHPEPLVLQLQRTIGNRATTRLLQRQPTATEEEVRADVERERARFDARMAEDKLRRAEAAERLKPHALKQAGITTDSQVDDETPKWIQAALAESEKLRPYLKDKFPGSAITAKGAFEIHGDPDDFNEAVKTAKGVSEPLTKRQLAERYGTVGGVFNRKTRKIHVRSHTKFGHAMHEAMHRVAHPAFHGFWEEFINEGVTQLFADCVLVEQGLTPVTDHDYKAELACAKALVAATNLDTVARAYFLNDGKLRDALMARFGIRLDALRQEIHAGTFCRRFAPASRP
jgi:hypothetical protein